MTDQVRLLTVDTHSVKQRPRFTLSVGTQMLAITL